MNHLNLIINFHMKKILTKVLCISAVCIIVNQHTVAQQQKYALVIGAQNYVSLPPLRNSLADAKDLALVLSSKGFRVETLLDPRTKTEIKNAIIRYKNAMENIEGGVGIIFYAGHGMQFEGNNYIIPTMASLELSSDLDDQCLKMNAVMSVLNATNKSLNILFLDACRTIPSFNRDSEQGWTKVNAPRGSIIVFATEAGKVASDGNGKNGLFTSKLVSRINEPGLNINELLKKVKQDVFAESNEKQLPSLEDNSIGSDFFFTPGSSATITTIPITRPISQPIEKSKQVEPAISGLDYGYGTVDARTVLVGTQEWQAKNLNVDRFANGERIPEAKTDKEWARAIEKKRPAWCYYDYNAAYGSKYGKLYNWYAMADPRGLAPKGWHVPNDDEWRQLSKYLLEVNVDVLNLNGDIIIKALNDNGKGKNKVGGGNKQGGYGRFERLNESFWWSSELNKAGSVWPYAPYRNAAGPSYDDFKRDGYSVLCVKD